MIERVRPRYSLRRLKEIYPEPHQHHEWEDHRIRVEFTISLARPYYKGGRVVDLSCGDGKIARSLDPLAILGDFAPGHQFTGPIEKTIDRIEDCEMFVLCETLEHLDDPLDVLKRIREKTRSLVLSTPENEQAENEQHYWRWDHEGVAQLLSAASFTPQQLVILDFPRLGARYQIWVAE